MKTALISVYDKTGITKFAAGLVRRGWRIVSTSDTAAVLRDAEIAVTDVSEITGFSEILDGRVKSLHPAIYGGLLHRRDNTKDVACLNDMNISGIDMVVNNLYPFEEVLKKNPDNEKVLLEHIDIGGVSMIRAAAKNYHDVYILTNTGMYQEVLTALDAKTPDQLALRKRLAAQAFSYTAYYDAIISNYFNTVIGEKFPERVTYTYKKKQDLRYGENPHQKSAVYEQPDLPEKNYTEFTQLHGKELSYNNLIDIYAAVRIIKEFDEPTAVAIKHTNPSGIGSGDSLDEAFSKAYACDTESIFGGIISVNRELDEKTAKLISGIFIEIVIAPDFSQEALDTLTAKKNIRLLKMPNLNTFVFPPYIFRQVLNGIVIQDQNTWLFLKEAMVVSKRTPNPHEVNDLIFAWKAVKNINSNAAVLCRDKQTLAIGQGEVRRFWSVEKSLLRAEQNVKDAVLASDGFFFADTIELLADHGIRSIIQPGGSVKDQEVIDLADKYHMALIFTGTRHFKH